MNTVSRLAFLMSAMDITGRKLADAIHIDYSQISRWKNNRRPLSSSSIYAKKIAAYFLSLEQSRSSHFLESILKEYDPDLNPDRHEELINCLCKWLGEQGPLTQHQISALSNKSSVSHDAVYRVYQGNEGRRVAAIEFLDYVLSLPDEQQLMLVSQEDVSWIIEDPAFLNLWKQKLIEVLQKNHKIRIIHWVDRDVEKLAAIVSEWLPMHLTGNIESWFYPIYADIPYKATLFIIQDLVAVTGMTSQNPAQNRYTAYYTDPITVAQCEWIYKNILAECRPLNYVSPKSKMDKLFEMVAVNNTKKKQSYFYADTPLLLATSEEILLDVLEDNLVDSATIERCLRFHKFLNHFLYNNYLNRHIYFLDRLKQAAELTRYQDYLLSAVTGQDIIISHLNFINYINFLIDRINNQENYEVALITNSTANNISIQVWVEQNSSVIAWSTEPYLPYATSATEPTIVNTFYQIYNRLWQSIPKIYRNKDWVVNELQTLIT